MPDDQKKVTYVLEIGDEEVARAVYIIPGEATPPPASEVFGELLATPVTVSLVVLTEYQSKKGKDLNFEVHANTGDSLENLANNVLGKAVYTIISKVRDEELGLKDISVDFAKITELLRAWAMSNRRLLDAVFDKTSEEIAGEYPVVMPAFLFSNVKSVAVDVTLGQSPPAGYPNVVVERWWFTRVQRQKA